MIDGGVHDWETKPTQGPTEPLVTNQNCWLRRQRYRPNGAQTGLHHVWSDTGISNRSFTHYEYIVVTCWHCYDVPVGNTATSNDHCEYGTVIRSHESGEQRCRLLETVRGRSIDQRTVVFRYREREPSHYTHTSVTLCRSHVTARVPSTLAEKTFVSALP